MPQYTAGLYQVNLNQTIGANQILNVFWYRSNTGGNTFTNDLWNAFNIGVHPEIAAIQHSNVNYTTLSVKAIFGTELETTAPPTITTGAVVGTLLPAFNVASIQLLRSSTELRSGWKRFSGVTEENVSSPGFITAYMDLLDDLAQVLDNPITQGGNTFTPIIVRKPNSTPTQGDNWNAIDIQSAVALNRVTTQNSRKTF